jgi:FOG: FHA domain
MHETDELPKCPRCGGSRFRRDSIFESRQDHGPPTREFTAPSAPVTPDWLPAARHSLTRAGHHLVFRDENDSTQTFTIERGWTRIGRSMAADLCLDDPSVSHRHALIVAEPGKALRVLDDRSLNGVFVNGRPIEWGPLHDGDELRVGRYRLYLLHA